MTDKKIEELRFALRAALDYIDAIPDEVADRFPVMPGFDRDWVEGLFTSHKTTKAPLVLADVIDTVSSGLRPDYDDLRYAVLALNFLLTLDRHAFMNMAKQEAENIKIFPSAQWEFEEHFNRVKRAYEKTPKEYVGWNNDPDNPDNRQEAEA